jgi:hypothetical protein
LGAVENLLEQASDGLPARAWIVVRLEHLELVSLDEILASEQNGRDLFLLDKASQALRMDFELPRGFYEVKIVVERVDSHDGLDAKTR